MVHIPFDSPNGFQQEATLAWKSLGEPPPASVELWREASRSKPAIYRLTFGRSRRPSVYAKRSRKNDMALERAMYQEILPRLPVTVPRYFGSCRADDGSTWTFFENLGDRRPTGSAGHRVLTAQWLGLLHRSAAADGAAARLPDGGPSRYLSHLRVGRDGILRNLGNPALTVEDRAVLRAHLDQLDALESHWPQVEQACAGLPLTLVHGDFRAKNVRLRTAAGTTSVFALDWEMAGWGIPAGDLAGAWGPGMTLEVDARAYQKTVEEMGLDEAAVHRLAILGRIFQALSSTKWAAASLIFEATSHLLRPVSQMRLYRTQVAEAIGAGAEWLGWS